MLAGRGPAYDELLQGVVIPGKIAHEEGPLGYLQIEGKVKLPQHTLRIGRAQRGASARRRAPGALPRSDAAP